MYKIIDNVDLSELEKFDYKKDTQGNYSKRVMKDRNSGAWTYFETIEINKEDRIIRTRLYQDCADQEWFGYIEKTGRYIYDLEKAGLIEEVKKEKNNLVLHAERELNILIEKCKEEKEATELQEIMNKYILEVVEVFANQGHSGFSASYAIDVINRLLKYEPITALTGEESEWTKLEYINDECYQNIRCSRVFKGKDGKAYDIEGKIFSDNGGKTWHSSRDSKVYIEFPYTPHTEKVILETKEE